MNLLRTSIFLLLTLALPDWAAAQDTDKPTAAALTEQQQLAYRQHFWDSLPRPVGWVNDFEGLFTPREYFVLDSTLASFNKETGIEIAIVTLDSLCTRPEEFDQLVVHIANSWGVGDAEKDNGMVIGLSRGNRKIRITYGQGISTLISDIETKDIIDELIIPYLRSREYYLGTVAGLGQLLKYLRM